jgi:O-antigen/teichoic acid export membrane protein
MRRSSSADPDGAAAHRRGGRLRSTKRLLRLRKLLDGRPRLLLGNIVARVAALACVFAATLLLARNGGPAVVGVYALLHVLPGLVGTMVSSGLPVAVPYFLAGPERDDPRLNSTLLSMAAAGGITGSLLWILSAPLFGPVLFPDLSFDLVMLAGVAVSTRLATITAKACSQGSEDLPGSNRVIVMEQFMFLPSYSLLWLAGGGRFGSVVGGLLLSDVATSSVAWLRLARRHFFRDATRPSLSLAGRVASYGLRAQLGGVMTQLNLRLDFVLLTLMTGPAVVGVYAVASKFAELVRILGMALTYVLYPTFAREGRVAAAASVRKLAPKAALLTVGVIVPLWAAAGLVIPSFYGSEFESAVTSTRIILLGLTLEGVAGVIAAFLYASGRPGLYSVGVGAGLAVTVVLDLLLIPPFEGVGAAIASAVAYLTSALALVAFFWRLGRPQRAALWKGERVPSGDAG